MRKHTKTQEITQVITPSEETPGNLNNYKINEKKALLTLMLSSFIDILGYTMILPLLPSIGLQFGATELLIGLLISINSLFALIFGPIWGRLSDKYGRKPMLFLSQIGTLIAFIVLALSNSIWGIFLSRILDGISGGQIPINRAYVTDISDDSNRTEKMSKLTLSFSLGLVIGPSIGGLLGSLNWRYPAYLAIGLALTSMILTQVVLVETMPKERRDYLTGLAHAEKTDPTSKKSSLFTKEIIMLLIQSFLLIFAFSMYNSSLSLVIHSKFGQDPGMIGLIMTVMGVEMIFFSGFLVKKLVRKYEEKHVFLFAILMMGTAFLIYPFLTEFWMLFLLITPFMLGMAILRPILQTKISQSAPRHRQGEISGYNTTTQSIAETIAPLISTGYLQIGMVVLFGVEISPYILIGFTCAAVFYIFYAVASYFYKIQKTTKNASYNSKKETPTKAVLEVK